MRGNGNDRAQKVQIYRQFGDRFVERGLINERLHHLQQWRYSETVAQK